MPGRAERRRASTRRLQPSFSKEGMKGQLGLRHIDRRGSILSASSRTSADGLNDQQPSWLHRDLSPEEAEAILTAAQVEGGALPRCFLVRAFHAVPGRFTVSYTVGGKARHYPIQKMPGSKSYFTRKRGNFATLEEAVTDVKRAYDLTDMIAPVVPSTTPAQDAGGASRATSPAGSVGSKKIASPSVKA